MGHCTFSGPPGFSPQSSAEIVHSPGFSCGSCEPLSDLDVHLQGFAHSALHPAVPFAPGEAEGSPAALGMGSEKLRGQTSEDPSQEEPSSHSWAGGGGHGVPDAHQVARNCNPNY